MFKLNIMLDLFLIMPKTKFYTLPEIRSRKVKPSKEFTCTIINQNGKTVYEWYDQNTGWDGKINNKPATSGTYFYIINGTGIDNRKYVLKGTLLLVR